MRILSRLVFTLALTVPAWAGQPEPRSDRDWLDALWDLRQLYENPDAAFVQELRFSGFYAGQYYAVRGNGGDNDDGWDHRRLRWGLRARMWQDLFVRAEIYSEPQHGDLYAGIWNATVTWKPSNEFELTVGKFRPRWSLEGEESSMDLYTFERSMLVNLARPENLAGLAVEAEAGRWDFYAGVFSGAEGPEFGNFNGGAVGAFSVAYELEDHVGWNKADLRLDYLFGDTGDATTGKGPWAHNLALSLDVEHERWSWRAEAQLLAGKAPTAVGFTFEPTYFISPLWQIVARYHVAASRGDTLRLRSRYERTLDSVEDGGRGKFYQSAYLGLNWHLKKDRLKLMTGVEWANMDGGDDGGGYHGWTWLSGVRVEF